MYTNSLQNYNKFWTCANKKQKISAKKFRHALKREHFEMLKGTIPKIQKKVLRPVVYQPYQANYASLLAPKCQKNHAKCIFFEFSCQKIWSCQKKAVPLHPLSFKEHQIAPSGGSQFPRLTGTLPGAIVQWPRTTASHAVNPGSSPGSTTKKRPLWVVFYLRFEI